MWLSVIERGFAVAGFTFFSAAVTSGLCLGNLSTAAIAGGMYLFVEAMRILKIKTDDKRAHTYLIF